MAKAPAPPTQTAITRDDLERSFQALQDGVRGQVDDKKSTIMTAAGVGGLLAGRDHLPARQAQRQEEDDVRRDPPGLTAMANRLPLVPSPS